MKYVSLRGTARPCSISAAITSGLASDGGLLVPETWPKIQINSSWSNLKFSAFAARLIAPFFSGDELLAKLPSICEQAFTFNVPLVELGDGSTVLELFHGPTGAFKDFGARFLALCIDALVDPRASERLVLVATSGDTGGAVAAAFHDCTKIPVGILYPKGGVSQRQEKQLTVWGERVRAFSVRGSFDDCQRVVKEALTDSAWKKKYQLISANSINLGRLLPQMAYFAYASLEYLKRHQGPAEIIIPSGNMGNAAAALWAHRLGFPIRRVIFAHNANHAVADYFNSGVWKPNQTIPTLANAMDVGNPSNFERIRSLYSELAKLKAVATALSVSDQEIRDTILKAKAKWNRVFCPHTATALLAGMRLPDPHWMVAATAHPSKFETILEPLIGEVVEVPAELQVLFSKRSQSFEIEATLNGLELAMQSWKTI